MEIHYNLISTIDFLGLLQGIILGIILIAGSQKNKPSLFLGLFLITFSTELINPILDDTKILEQKPNLLFLPFDFLFLHLPLLYLYAKNLIGKVSIQNQHLILLPGLVEFIGMTILFFMPLSVKQSIDNSSWILFYYLGGMTFSIYYVILTIRLIHNHQKRVVQYFSDIQNRQLKWVKAIAIYLLIFASIIISGLFLNQERYDNSFYFLNALINVVFIYWVGLSGLKQAKIEIPHLDIADSSTPTPKKTSPKPIDETEETYQKLLAFMNTQKPFINAELNLTELANNFGIPPKKLSQVINQKSGVNFNRFINQYRIEAAKAMLTNNKFDHLNVIGIGYEVGFNSKASFYAVFKQITNTTPARFKKQWIKNAA